MMYNSVMYTALFLLVSLSLLTCLARTCLFSSLFTDLFTARVFAVFPRVFFYTFRIVCQFFVALR